METLVILAAAGEKPPPLIDFDATVFVQFGIFCVLWVVLTKFVFGPYIELKRQQTASTDGARKSAEEQEISADEARATYDAGMTVGRKAVAAHRTERRDEGDAAAQSLLSDARARAQKKLDEARARIRKTAEAAEAELPAKAEELASVVAEKVLGRAL